MKFLTAYVEVDADDRKLKRNLPKTKRMVARSVDVMQRKINSISFRKAALGAAAFGAATVYAASRFVKVASSAEEIQSKFNTVFRNLKGEANAWADDFGASVGRARQDVKMWMGTLQDTFVPLGFAREEAFGLSKSLVKLSVDVASFNNAADANVMRDFTSALVGNHETVRKYGILIGENEIVQAAMNAGIDKTYKELTALEKVQMRYNIILSSTTDAQGDAIRTGNSYANQVKRLKANLKDAAEVIGTAFLPVFTDGVAAMNRWLISNQGAVQVWAAETGARIAYVKDYLFAFGTYLKNDFPNAVDAGLGVTGIAFKVWANDLIAMAEYAFSHIGANAGVWLKRAWKRPDIQDDLLNEIMGSDKYAADVKAITGKGKWGSLFSAPSTDQRQQLNDLEGQARAQAASMLQARLIEEVPDREGMAWAETEAKLAKNRADGLEEAKKFVATTMKVSDHGQTFADAITAASAKLDAALAKAKGVASTTEGMASNHAWDQWKNVDMGPANIFESATANGGKSIVDDQKKVATEVESVWQSVGSSISSSITGAFAGIMQKSITLKEGIANVGQSIMNTFMQIAMKQAVMAAVGGMGMGGGMMMPAFASGGITSGPSLAGEAGPEAVVPLPDGRTIPVQMQGGGGGTSVVVNVINETGNKVDAEQKQMRIDGNQMILDVVLQSVNGYGPMYHAIQGVNK